MKGNIITGLDIGTSSIKALVVQRTKKDWEVLSFAEIPSFGLRKGAVINAEEVSKNVQMIISGIEKDCGRKINSVFVNVGGSRLYVMPSDGIISVSRADQRISKEDVDRVLQATRAINMPRNDEILDVVPKEFIIDDQRGIKQPVDLTGIRLEAKVLLLCVFSPDFLKLTQSVLNSKIQIDDIVPSPLAAANSVLTPQQKELGVVLIDIGASATSMAVFEEGDLIHLAVIPIGSGNITNDIAIGLKTDVAMAESIKKQHGTCIMVSREKVKKEHGVKKIEIFEKSSSLSFTKKNIVDIIEPRVSEILDLVQKELKKINKQEQLPGGIVLTGGGAKLPKIRELAKQTLKLSCEIGTPKGIVGIEDDPSLATVAGLVLGGLEDIDGSDKEGILGLLGNLLKKIRKMLKALLP
ncbi:MAG: cell division protein FtsA [Candidatus Staskawiczbacteria bacterium RIFOXYC1_FULL_37_43]|nr:MAG: cell division protein FtsA [Candidatus Staskawiczbacteria bacterium RIFCSPHIGHO2_01_FULL_37_17]OGZ71804.1 MAG: cell division protein FtsA [Candidatus Staskawiczbacteria bacterium RIFCSPLOWO2_01_FULL_37_19]OGZ75694.1 MAG: cell division protein FtsA [Candidatus Staskawiczbacteria bacterium RIFOXYA1_FULL_37_15]OGZ77254.1 MAG: cell division protein FtsA [Candidatus Staskawiczbacteria bacterium RIFOXYA12_FULL_37_10]OGZ80585.1 MAG: cell division protein FtsA [Candidatus Staskawiczbacteria bac